MTRSRSMTLHAASRAATGRIAARTMATRSTLPASNVKAETLSPLYTFGGVHGSRSGQKTWRNKPLFRREVRTCLYTSLIGFWARCKSVKWTRSVQTRRYSYMINISWCDISPLYRRSAFRCHEGKSGPVYCCLARHGTSCLMPVVQ